MNILSTCNQMIDVDLMDWWPQSKEDVFEQASAVVLACQQQSMQHIKEETISLITIWHRQTDILPSSDSLRTKNLVICVNV